MKSATPAMKWVIVILVLFVAGVAILAYANFTLGSILSYDAICRETVMPAVYSRYNSLNDLEFVVLLTCTGFFVWRVMVRK